MTLELFDKYISSNRNDDKKCIKCGYIAKWNHKYCGMCGNKL